MSQIYPWKREHPSCDRPQSLDFRSTPLLDLAEDISHELGISLPGDVEVASRECNPLTIHYYQNCSLKRLS